MIDPDQIEELAEALAGRLRERPETPSRRAGLSAREAGREGAPLAAPDPLPTRAEIARYIDHTQLGPDAPREAIERLCEEAREHGFYSVCVHGANVRLASQLLRGARTRVCAVVGFPLGVMTPSARAFEAREAMRQGASEIDMVLNRGALRSGDFALIHDDVAAVVEAVPGKLVKVILECAELDEREIVIACALAKGAGAHFVKTSTGFGAGGAALEDVALMRQIVGPDMGVKASGGVRDFEAARAMLEAGASRLGCSSSVAIVTGQGDDAQGY